MTAEITAQELAAKAVDMFGEGERVESWLTGAQEFLILTRAHAALQAERQKAAQSGPTDMLLSGQLDPADKRDRADMLAAEMAQPTEAPGRVRCWYNPLDDEYTADTLTALAWHEGGCSVIPGHFIPEAHE